MSKVEKLVFFDPDTPSEDAIDGLLNRLSGDDSKAQAGCRIHRNSENGNIAVFPSVPFFPQRHPEQLKLENAWESRSLEMHSQQVPIQIDPKPCEEIVPKYHEIETRRGD